MESIEKTRQKTQKVFSSNLLSIVNEASSAAENEDLVEIAPYRYYSQEVSTF